MADALVDLVASLTVLKDETVHIPLCHKWILPSLPILQKEEVNATLVLTMDNKDWRQPLINYLEHKKLPNELRCRIEIWRRAPHFIYYKETLYHHSFNGILFRCLGKEEANQIIEEVHSWNLWGSPIKAKASFSNQNDGLLLVDDG